MITTEQFDKLQDQSTQLVKHKQDIAKVFSKFVKDCQKLGYGVNPKTGHLNKLK